MKYCLLFIALLSILAVFEVDVAASRYVADIHPGQVYWNKVLPNTPIPAAIKQLLNTVGKRKVFARDAPLYQGCYITEAADTLVHHYMGTALFFFEKDVHPGNEVTFMFTPTIATSLGGTPFLSRHEANSIPFTSTKFIDILEHFSIQPDSAEAEMMKKTLAFCEHPAMGGESKHCATSLESMIDFSMATIGTRNIQLMLMKVDSEKERTNSAKQQYTITSSSSLKSVNNNNDTNFDNLVVCHSPPYAYAVFYCHMIRDTKAYKIQMVGKDGTKVETVAVCHHDTAEWNPNHLAFKLLHVKPGTEPICHFLGEDALLWTPTTN